MQRIITSRKKVSITRDEGWYSETEMKADLKWSQYLGWFRYYPQMIINFMGVLFQQWVSVPRQRISGAKAFCSAPERAAKFVRPGSQPSQFASCFLRPWRQEEYVWLCGRVLGHHSRAWHAWRGTWGFGEANVYFQGRVEILLDRTF